MSLPLRTIALKLLALGILGLVLIAAARLIWHPLAARLSAAQTGIEEQRYLLGKLTAAIARQTEARDLMRRADTARLDTLFLAGTSDASKLAGLQAQLNKVAQASGVRLASTSSVKPRQEGDVRLIGVKAQLRTALPQLQEILFQLETRRPPLIVDSLQISHPVQRGGPGPEMLDIQFVVLGATSVQEVAP